MDLTTYTSFLLSSYKDSRVKKNVLSLLSRIRFCSGKLKLFKMSKDKAEYDVFKGLLNNSQKNTLSSQIVLEAVRKRCIEELGDSQKIYLLHDRCDIR